MKASSNFTLTTDFNYHLGDGSPQMKDIEKSKASMRKQMLWKMVQQLIVKRSRSFQMVNHSF